MLLIAPLQAWRQGRTGYPLVDAAMREVRCAVLVCSVKLYCFAHAWLALAAAATRNNLLPLPAAASADSDQCSANLCLPPLSPTQLWGTGWMHNRMRVVAASFLVKNLLLPWQVGVGMDAWSWGLHVWAGGGSMAGRQAGITALQAASHELPC